MQPQPVSFDPVTWQGLCLRLGCALLAGGIVGFEREKQDKPAGLRTNMLASFGAAIFVLVSTQTGASQQSAEAFSRVVQGVITGIGFLGAGTILRDTKVHGLTSAAAVWVSASLGIAAASGLWFLSLVGAVLTWIVLNIFERVEDRF